MPILIRTDADETDRKWMPMDVAVFVNEDELQALLQSDSAELIPPDPSLDEPFVAYVRELWTAAGPIDLVGIGSSGSITVMECKLARNQQIRREVVGQVLDYASAIAEMDFTSFVGAFKTAAGRDPFETLRALDAGDEPAFDEEACRAEIARRLADGDLRLLIAVDEIDADLRRIIQYVNRLAGRGRGLKLVAVEFKRFRSGSTEVLAPETYGDEPPASASRSRELTDVQQLHLDYWTELQGHVAGRESQVSFGKPPSTSTYDSKTTPSGFVIQAYNRMNDGRSGVGLLAKTPAAVDWMRTLDWGAISAQLARHGTPERDQGTEPRWIYVNRDGRVHGMPTDRANWPGLMDWMADAIEGLWSIAEVIEAPSEETTRDA